MNFSITENPEFLKKLSRKSEPPGTELGVEKRAWKRSREGESRKLFSEKQIISHSKKYREQ